MKENLIKERLFMKRCYIFAALMMLALLLSSFQPEKRVSNVILRDVNDEPIGIKSLGKNLFLLFYIDPDRQHILDPLTDAVDSINPERINFEVVPVLNCKDTWIPYSGLRAEARRRQKRHPGSPVLLDTNHSLSGSWNMGDCDNASIVAIVRKDLKICYLKTFKSEEECRKNVVNILKILGNEPGQKE